MCVHVHVRKSMCASVYVHACLSIHACVCTCLCTCMDECVCVCMHVRMCMLRAVQRGCICGCRNQYLSTATLFNLSFQFGFNMSCNEEFASYSLEHVFRVSKYVCKNVRFVCTCGGE